MTEYLPPFTPEAITAYVLLVAVALIVGYLLGGRDAYDDGYHTGWEDSAEVIREIRRNAGFKAASTRKAKADPAPPEGT